jgi:hypothetical protein
MKRGGRGDVLHASEPHHADICGSGGKQSVSCPKCLHSMVKDSLYLLNRKLGGVQGQS